MKVRLAARVVAVASLITVLGVVAAHVIRGWASGPESALPVLGNAAVTVTYTAIGWLIVERRGRNVVGPLLLTIGALYALAGPADLYLQTLFFQPTEPPPGSDVAGLIVMTVGYPITFSLATAMMLFPDGRPLSRVWLPIIAVVFAAAGLGVAGQAFGWSTFTPFYPSIDSPFAIPGFPKEMLLSIADAGMQVALVAAAVCLFLRWRRGNATQRAQTKWVMAATTIVAGAAIVAATTISAQYDWVAWWASNVSTLTLCLLPIAMGIAILRYRLYTIDRIVSRSLSYAVITSVLAGVFGATAVALSSVLGSLAQGESLAVAASTLLVLAMFGPLRRRAQSAIDRRFDRARYDASVTVQAMSARLRDDVDLERVEADVLGVVDRTFHPTRAGVWLRVARR